MASNNLSTAPVDEKEALREVLGRLKAATPKRTAYRIALDHNFNRSSISQWIHDLHHVSGAMKSRIVAALMAECAKAGIPFPVELFREYIPVPGDVDHA